MSDTETLLPPKKILRKKSTKTSASISVSSDIPSSLGKQIKMQEDVFLDVLGTITQTRDAFVKLQKDIVEMQESWVKEQERHEKERKEQRAQEELVSRREKEAYDYETARARRQTEDEFAEKKAKWEKELTGRKEEIAKDKEELALLRSQVAGFAREMERAVKEAQNVLGKELTERFATERKLREQEVKAEKELLGLKIINLTSENARQAKEIEAFKIALENATAQLKEIAVKVIESSSTQKPQIPSES